jgi:hypothetical protein
MNLHSEAEALADIIIKLSTGADKNKKILKLPPVFTANNHKKYGDGKRNLIAIIKCSADYEDLKKNYKLNQVIEKYNSYGGKPELTFQDLRKVHNWLQLINYILRIALMEKFNDQPDTKIVDEIVKTLFTSTRRAFVAHPDGKKYELKPLKYADVKTISKWISIELNKKRAGDIPFSYEPSQREWELYGLRGQTKTAYNSLMKDIHNLVKKARTFDESGEHNQADVIYDKLVSMQKSLEQITNIISE